MSFEEALSFGHFRFVIVNIVLIIVVPDLCLSVVT